MEKKSNIIIASFLLFLATLFWSGNFIVGKIAGLNEIPPISLNFFRWSLAFLILLPFTYKEMIEKKKLILKNILLLCFLGITAVSIFNSALFYSLKSTQVITGVLMISTVPVMIIFFSSLLKIERTNSFQIAGVIFSLLGVIFIISKANFEVLKTLNFEKGDLFALFAMISWSLYSTLLKKKNYELSQLTLLQVVIGLGVIFLIPMYLIDYIYLDNRIIVNTNFILVLSYVVLLPGIIAFFFWIKGVAYIGANKAGIYLHLMPILAAILAMIIFDEILLFYHYIGAMFIISGILLSNKKNA
tara:strand:+ start:857 stop:1759 length:903 start_codon:yes stop_codon:yes gene_type:complete